MRARLRGPRVHVIKSIEIHGFLGQSSKILLNMDRHTNFIIGRNGAGKTTLINFVKGMLAVDVPLLRSVRFETVLIKLKKDRERSLRVVQIDKNSGEEEDRISYTLWKTSNRAPEEFVVFNRRKSRIRLGDGRSVHAFLETPSQDEYPARRSLIKILNDTISFTWLSLHRRDSEVEVEEVEEEWEEPDDFEDVSDVDRKLSQVFNSLTRYFYRLDARVAQSLQEFQKRWFLSFLSSDKRSDPAMLLKIDTQKEKESLVSIFENFSVDRSSFFKDLENQFKRFEEIRAQSLSQQITSLSKIAVLIDTLRLHYLVDEWQNLEIRKEEILIPKNLFTKICNQMLFRKKVEVNSNTVLIIDMAGKRMSASSLSSGEKQLLIFLSETLLQEGAPHIFLADEPELSLHIEWQEELVSNLLKINPNAQVVFATHSPDIVSKYTKNVIRMEKILK